MKCVAIFSAVKSGNELTINGFFWATDDQGKAASSTILLLTRTSLRHPLVDGVVYVLPQTALNLGPRLG
jgi:hypothetical protein